MNDLMRTLSIFLLMITIGCASKQTSEGEQANVDEWPEMDAFHMIMAETFHPYKDSSNLEPLKTQAQVLKAEAEKWAQAPLPAKVNNDAMKARLQQLKMEATGLAEMVNTASDSTIANALVELHDQFHALQEVWYSGEKHEHHE
jgi:hypothetical protein